MRTRTLADRLCSDLQACDLLIANTLEKFMVTCLHRQKAALALAIHAHVAQLCKSGDDPYIVHAAHVSRILLRPALSKDEPIAGTRGI
jgi:(p)ppGpp synthase/HD superfamily hydrolase